MKISSPLSRRAFLGTCGLGIAATLAGCSGSNQTSGNSSAASGDSYSLVEPGKLTLVSEFYYPPFEMLNDDNQPEGFDIDVYGAICDKMGLEQNILPNMKFDAIIPTIKQGGKADVALGCIIITDERLEQVDFSDPYMDSNQALVVPATSDISNTEQIDVENNKVAVQSGTTSEAWAEENISKATIVPLDDIVQGLTGVQTGLYNGILLDLPVANYEIRIAYNDLKIAQEIPTGEQCGVAISKDNPNLTKAVNKAIEEIKADGTLDQLEQKWFGTTL